MTVTYRSVKGSELTWAEQDENTRTNNTFDPAWTGAVPRPIDTRLGDWVSIKDFGDVGAGQDATAAINAALAASIMTIYFPPGLYKFSNIDLSLIGAGVRFVGASTFQTIFQFLDSAQAGDQLFYHSGSGTSTFPIWEGIRFDVFTGTNTPIDGIAINLDYMNNSSIQNCMFLGATGQTEGSRLGVAVQAKDTPLGGTYNSRFWGGLVRDLSIGFRNQSNFQHLYGVEFLVCDTGIDNSYGFDSLSVAECRTEGCQYGIKEAGTQTTYHAVRNENNSLGDIRFYAGAADCTIVGGLSAVTSPILVDDHLCVGKMFLSLDGAGVRIATDSASRPIRIGDGDGDRLWLGSNNGRMGFYGVVPIDRPTLTGSLSGGAALANLVTLLESMGVLVDSTTA